MSVGQEELIAEEDAERYLGVSPERLRELVTQGVLRIAIARGAEGLEPMYFRSDVLRLKEHLTDQGSKSGTEEWPDIINE